MDDGRPGADCGIVRPDGQSVGRERRGRDGEADGQSVVRITFGLLRLRRVQHCQTQGEGEQILDQQCPPDPDVEKTRCRLLMRE